METTYTIKIKRRKDADSPPYWQNFMFSGDNNLTVSDLLDRLNFTDDLFDANGNAAPRIRWECSCQQGVCGACAMVICGVPALACKTKLSVAKHNVLVLEPLSKFPVVCDLCVDRSAISDFVIENKLWLTDDAVHTKALLPLQYAAAKCMKCGLCLEVCPNTAMNSKSTGACFAAEYFLNKTLDSNPTAQKQVNKGFRRTFAANCSKSLSCAAVCPAGIDLKRIITLMNR